MQHRRIQAPTRCLAVSCVCIGAAWPRSKTQPTLSQEYPSGSKATLVRKEKQAVKAPLTPIHASRHMEG